MKVIGLAGWSGAGKTTLLSRVIPHLAGQGLRVSVIKHAHHGFDVDVPGKDSWVHRQSGATEVLVSSGKRWALMHELRGAAEPRLPELLRKMSPVDLVVVEGFKSESASQDRGASRWPTASRYCSRPMPRSRGLRPMLRLKPRCRLPISMISRPSPP